MMNLTPLLLLLLVGSLQLVSGSSYAPNSRRGPCCGKTTRVKLPLHRVTSYFWTNKDCPIKAVIFRMNDGKQFCVDLKAPWVKNHVKVLDSRSKPSKTSMPSKTSTPIKMPSTPSTPSTTSTQRENMQSPHRQDPDLSTSESNRKSERKARSSCCKKIKRVIIPLHRITSYFWTSSDCPIKAVSFRINNRRQYCVDPEAPWIKKHMKVVDLKQKSSTTSRIIKPSTS